MYTYAQIFIAIESLLRISGHCPHLVSVVTEAHKYCYKTFDGAIGTVDIQSLLKNTYMIFEGLTLPLQFKNGRIIDGAGQIIIEANRNANTTPLSPAGRDAILELTVALLNEAFEHDKADRLLKKLGY